MAILAFIFGVLVVILLYCIYSACLKIGTVRKAVIDSTEEIRSDLKELTVEVSACADQLRKLRRLARREEDEFELRRPAE